MTTPVDLSVGLLRRFAEFTKKLTPEQLEGVVAGTVKFGLLEPKAPRAAAPTLDAEYIAATLGEMNSRDAAAGLLDGMKLNVAAMKQLAQALGAPLAGATKKDDIRDRIVEHTVGFRLNSQTIRHGSWSSQ